MFISKNKLTASTALAIVINFAAQASALDYDMLDQTHSPSTIEDLTAGVIVSDNDWLDQTHSPSTIEDLTAGVIVSIPNPYLEPLVEFKDGKVVSRTVTKDAVDDLKLMNEAAYNIVKGYGVHNELAQQQLDQLAAKGWEKKEFYGLEGTTSNFGMVAGFVFYHEKTNRAVVAYSGTASNVEGWETNFDNKLVGLNTLDLLVGYKNDVYNHADKIIEKILKAKKFATDDSYSLSQDQINGIEGNLGIGINVVNKAALKKIAAKINAEALKHRQFSQTQLMDISQKLTAELLAGSDLTKDQIETIAKAIAREAVITREAVEYTESKEFRAAIKEFRDTIHNINEESNFGHGNSKSETQIDEAYDKVTRAYGELKLKMSSGKIKVRNQIVKKGIAADGQYENDNVKELRNTFERTYMAMHNILMLRDKSMKDKRNGRIGEGKVHSGFIKKTFSTIVEVRDILKSVGVNSDTKLTFTGHSQAGGTGVQAMALLGYNYAEDLFGPSFDNKKSNNLSGYFWSAARAGDKRFAKAVNKRLIGKENVIRHNVLEDIVPIANANPEIARWIQECLPEINAMLKEHAGYGDVGYLAAQSADDTWKLAKPLYAAQGYDVGQFDELDQFIRTLAGVKLDQDQIPTALASKGDDESSWNPFRWIGKKIGFIKTTAKLGMAAANMGDYRKKMAELFMKRYAHIHLGFDDGTVNGVYMGAHFNPELIMDTDKCLEAGRKHEEAGKK